MSDCGMPFLAARQWPTYLLFLRTRASLRIAARSVPTRTIISRICCSVRPHSRASEPSFCGVNTGIGADRQPN